MPRKNLTVKSVTKEQFDELIRNWENSRQMAGTLNPTEREIVNSIMLSIHQLYEKSLGLVEMAEPASLINYLWMRDNSEYFEHLDYAFQDHTLPTIDYLEDIAFLSFVEQRVK